MSWIILVSVVMAWVVGMVWLQRRGVVTEDRPIGLVVRECITRKSGYPEPRAFVAARLRFYAAMLVGAPLAANIVVLSYAAAAKPGDAVKVVMAPAFLAGILGLLFAEERFVGASRGRRITFACLGGLVAAAIAAALATTVDPNAVLSTGG